MFINLQRNEVIVFGQISLSNITMRCNRIFFMGQEQRLFGSKELEHGMQKHSTGFELRKQQPCTLTKREH
jgi:hypothetical protein